MSLTDSWFGAWGPFTSSALHPFVALEEAGVAHEFVTIEGGGHGLRGGDRQEIEAGMNRWREFMMKRLGIE